MEISFGSRKLQKACSSKKNSDRKFGAENAKKIRLRLAELAAAETLADAMTLPQARCHALKADREGQFAVDAKHPFRLIFEPDHDPLPRKEDGGLDLTKVTRIVVIEVEDYH